MPSWYLEDAVVPEKFRLSHRIMWWRVRNFRIIIYRPYVIRKALLARTKSHGKEDSADAETAYNRCLLEAKLTISTIEKFWSQNNHTRVGTWYTLCVALAVSPDSEALTNPPDTSSSKLP